MGTGQLLGQPGKMLGVTCDVLASHTGGVAIFLIASFYGNLDNLWRRGPLWPECRLLLGVFITKFMVDNTNFSCFSYFLFLVKSAFPVRAVATFLPSIPPYPSQITLFLRVQPNLINDTEEGLTVKITITRPPRVIPHLKTTKV